MIEEMPMGRVCFAAIVAGLLGTTCVAADDAPAKGPSDQQLKAAKDAYAKFHGIYDAKTNPVTRATVHYFRFPERLQDGQVRDLPDLDFPYGWLIGSDEQLTDAGLKDIGKRKQLVALQIYGSSITAAGLKEIGKLPNLATLSIMQTKTTDEGLKELCGMKSLIELHLHGTQITDAGMKELKGLTNMQYLSLSKTKVGDVGLSNLKDMRHLKRLDLDESQVNDKALAALVEIDLLHALIKCHHNNQAPASRDEIVGINLWGCAISDEGLKQLKGLKNLANLYLSKTQVTAEGIKELKDLKNLHFIHMQPEQISDSMLNGLREAGLLHALNDCYDKDFNRPTGEDAAYRLKLSKTTITNEGLKELKALTNLAELDLEGTSLTDEGLPALKQLTTLKRIDLKDTKITDEGFEDLRKTLNLKAYRKPRK
jgi:Leucine-rich repeat (LRR) protein